MKHPSLPSAISRHLRRCSFLWPGPGVSDILRGSPENRVDLFSFWECAVGGLGTRAERAGDIWRLVHPEYCGCWMESWRDGLEAGAPANAWVCVWGWGWGLNTLPCLCLARWQSGDRGSASPSPPSTYIRIWAELDEKALPLEAQLAHLCPVEGIDLRETLRRKGSASEPGNALISNTERGLPCVGEAAVRLLSKNAFC